MLSLGIRAHDLPQTKTIEELSETVARVGFKHIQLALSKSFPELSEPAVLSPGLGNYVKQTFAKNEINIAILSCYCNIIHPDENQKTVLLDKFKTYIRYASTFGSKIVATETGCVDKRMHYTEKNYTEEAFEKVVDSVRMMTEEAEKYGVIVGIEPGINHPLYDLAHTKALIEAVDSSNLGIILDPSNLIRPTTYLEYNKIIEEAFQLFGSKIVAIHLKDFISNEKKELTMTNIGDGEMNIEETITQIQHLKPYIYTILEGTTGNKIQAARDKIINSY